MTYIILIAGVGKRLHPLTNSQPKCLFKLDNNLTILKRNIKMIKKYDKDSHIILIAGFKYEKFKDIQDVTLIYNPFFEITNSIASLWFAKEYLKDNVTIINGDIIMNSKLIKDIIVHKYDKSYILVDSTINNGDYNVQIDNDKVIVMSKELTNYYGEYVGITKLSSNDIDIFKSKLEVMIRNGEYQQWYENVLVQLIFDDNFILYYIDVKSYEWSEIDSVNDLIRAKKIHKNDLLYKEENI